MKKLLLVCVVSFGAVHGTEWKPCRDFLTAVAYVESSNGQYLYGDNGQSLGEFQLSEAAWLDVNQWRKSRGLKTYTYSRNVFNSYLNRVYAANYLTILHGELSRKLGRAPSHAEVYAAYNMGLGSFAQCKYNLKRVNPVTREKCRQINELMAPKNS